MIFNKHLEFLCACIGASLLQASQTPSIDRLAAEGTLLTDAYSANPLCCPTHASILTGQYPGRLNSTAASGHIQQ